MTDTHQVEGMTPTQRAVAEAKLEKIEKKVSTWLRQNHATIPCECDPRSTRRCTKGGWIRCNLRLAAMQAKRKELQEEVV